MSNGAFKEQPPRIPIWALILDIVGTLCLAAGLYGLFAGGDPPFSDVVDLRANAVALIVIGILLMIPLLVAVIRRAGIQARQ